MKHLKNFRKHDIVDEEILRAKVRRTFDAPAKSSKWERFSKNPLTTLTLGFLLTTLVGAALTYYFNQRLKLLEIEKNAEQRKAERERDERLKELSEQKNETQRNLDRAREDRNRDLDYQRGVQKQALERTQNFSDELSKTRVEKIGQV